MDHRQCAVNEAGNRRPGIPEGVPPILEHVTLAYHVLRIKPVFTCMCKWQLHTIISSVRVSITLQHSSGY